MSSENKIDRKEAIKRAGLLLGGVVFAPNILGVLNGCSATPGEWTPKLFSEKQARLVTALADVILPADDYPAASELGVPEFIETIVDEVYNEEETQEFLDGLDRFANDYTANLDADFFDGNDNEKYDFTYYQNRLAVEEDPESNPFILTFKQLTLLGYFTSEVGASEVLRYTPVPGRFDGCIPFEEVGKTWATD